MGHYTNTLHYTSDRHSRFERLRVDSAQTGFFEGREFRSFLELSLAAGASQTIRVTAPCEFILAGQTFSCWAGELHFQALLNPAPSGAWGTPLPVIGKNRLLERRSPYYTAQLTLDTGGTVTGGTTVEVVHVASVGTGANQGTVGTSMDDSRGLPVGTFYLRFTNTGATAAQGLYTLWWEERARHPSWPEAL